MWLYIFFSKFRAEHATQKIPNLLTVQCSIIYNSLDIVQIETYWNYNFIFSSFRMYRCGYLVSESLHMICSYWKLKMINTSRNLVYRSNSIKLLTFSCYLYGQFHNTIDFKSSAQLLYIIYMCQCAIQTQILYTPWHSF